MTLTQPTDCAAASGGRAGESTWDPVFPVSDLAPGRVLPVTVRGHAVVVFCTCDGEVFALADHDPHDSAPVAALSSGRLSSRRDRPVVVAPRSGRAYDLAAGRCLDGGAAVGTFPVRATGDMLEIALPAA